MSLTASSTPPEAPLDERGFRARLAPWAERYVRLMDEAWQIPGTNIRVGLDPILGILLPGVGDIASALGALAVLFLAVRHRVPGVVLLKMVFNVITDTTVGAVPVVGDAFDLFWRSNRKNLDLIEAYRQEPTKRPPPLDYLRVGLICFALICAVLLPLALVLAVASWLTVYAWTHVFH